jgi:hypothetical protein
LKVIVTASRTWDKEEKLFRALTALLIMTDDSEPFEVVHGAARRGGDQHASDWVMWQNWAKTRPAKWLRVARAGAVIEKAYPVSDQEWRASRAAGLHRNTKMVAENRDADLVVAFSRAGSRGTAHCVSQALQWELPVWFIDYDLDYPCAPNPIPSWWPANGIRGEGSAPP